MEEWATLFNVPVTLSRRTEWTPVGLPMYLYEDGNYDAFVVGRDRIGNEYSGIGMFGDQCTLLSVDGVDIMRIKLVDQSYLDEKDPADLLETTEQIVRYNERGSVLWEEPECGTVLVGSQDRLPVEGVYKPLESAVAV